MEAGIPLLRLPLLRPTLLKHPKATYSTIRPLSTKAFKTNSSAKDSRPFNGSKTHTTSQISKPSKSYSNAKSSTKPPISTPASKPTIIHVPPLVPKREKPSSPPTDFTGSEASACEGSPSSSSHSIFPSPSQIPSTIVYGNIKPPSIPSSFNLPSIINSKSSPNLPKSPLLTNPERYVPYSKRHPKIRFGMGQQKLNKQGEALKYNPYARMLDSQINLTAPTHVRLPSFLTVPFTILLHPEHRTPSFLPSNLLPSAASRQVKGEKSYVLNKHSVIQSLKKKNLWKKLVPDESRIPGKSGQEVRWREDMPEFVLSCIRKRAIWELENMAKHFDMGIRHVDWKGRILDKLGGKVVRDAEERVGCLLFWRDPQPVEFGKGPEKTGQKGKNKKKTEDQKQAVEDAKEFEALKANPLARKPQQQNAPLPEQMGRVYKLPTFKLVPVHDMTTLFGPVEAERCKQKLKLPPETRTAAIILYYQTYKAQMWLMKLRHYFA